LALGARRTPDCLRVHCDLKLPHGKLALQASRLAQFNTQHERSITLINQQLKGQADHLQQFEHTDRQVLQAMQETNLRNGRIEHRLTQIEDDHMELKRANARILGNEQKLCEQLDLLNTQMQAVYAFHPVDVPVPSRPAAPSDHAHNYTRGLPPPKRAQVSMNSHKEETWLISKDGKDQQVRPIEQTHLGYLVHNLTDGKDYILTPQGRWLDSSRK
jgi:septal ring factor EnvC (AmiA/AmiB activator)